MAVPEQCKIYRVSKTQNPVIIDSDWDKSVWSNVEPAELGYYMGKQPAHQPRVQFKLLYDDSNIYVIFKVDDQYIRAARQDYQSDVCKDSCVEFFFTPGSDISRGYFNIETNCISAMLLNHQKARATGQICISLDDCRKIEISSTFSVPSEREIQRKMTWVLEYRFPLSVMESYAEVEKPAAGIEWLCNFYKCGDETSRPHWLTWSKVDLPRPDFHQPEFFGKLIFD